MSSGERNKCGDRSDVEHPYRDVSAFVILFFQRALWEPSEHCYRFCISSTALKYASGVKSNSC